MSSMVVDQEIRLRRSGAESADIFRRWAEDSGWLLASEDLRCRHAVDDEGCLLAEVNGAPIGGVLATRFDDALGFAGPWYVEPRHRGQGVGRRLLSAAVQHLGVRAVAMDFPVREFREVCPQGFERAFAITRYAYNADSPRCPNHVMDIREVSFEAVEAYDMRCFGALRTSFLTRWWAAQGVVAKVVLNRSGFGGFGVMRRQGEGWHLGPVYADGPTEADALLAGFAEAARNRTIWVDVGDINPRAIELARRLQMDPQDRWVRACRGGRPDVDASKIFAVTGLQLG